MIHEETRYMADGKPAQTFFGAWGALILA